MDYKGINDYELMYRIRENDDDAVNIMISKYEPIIISIAKRYYPKVKNLGAEMVDLIQEGRIAVAKAIASFDPDGVSLFYTYVCVCIERHFITYHRNLSTNKHNLLNYSVNDECLYGISDLSLEPSNLLTKKYEEELFKNGKNCLNFLDSNILELWYNGFSYREICELLDISVGIVSSRLCKIKKNLQRIVNKF